MNGNVFVTDAQMRSSLAAIRSLGKQGLNVTGGEVTRFATGFFSKYCQNHFIYPSPVKDTTNFVQQMLGLIQKEKYDVLIPMTDDTLIPIIKHKKEFSKHSILPFADFNIIENALNKAKTIEIALKNDVDCPETYVIKDINELYEYGEFKYPVIIKPIHGYGSHGVASCNSSEELNKKARYIYENFGSFLIQDYIPYDSEVGVYALLNQDSELRAVTVQRRIRSYPVSGGPSTLRETVYNPELVITALRLLEAMKWEGVAMVEFRIDPRDGKPKLMEVNPRFWGSLNLSILSGVDFPYLLYKMAMEGDIESHLNYNLGMKCRWLLPGDMLWYITSPNKLGNLSKFINFKIPDDIISREDLGPTFGFILATTRYLFDKQMWRFVLKR